jgi:hypothetical protein
MHSEPITPTVEGIDAWRAQTEANKPEGAYYANDYDQYMVDIWTKASRARCVTSRVEHNGHIWYWTIKGEGSSNGCREYAIRADKIVRAVGHIIGNRDPRFQAKVSA